MEEHAKMEVVCAKRVMKASTAKRLPERNSKEFGILMKIRSVFLEE
jgi:hypothetical protein